MTIAYNVPGISCGHCIDAITTEVGRIPGVSEVTVDVASKIVTVRGDDLDDDALRAAIDEAGYEVG